MNPYHLAYNLIGAGIGAVLKPAWWLRARHAEDRQEQFRQRFGRYPAALRASLGGRGARIWMHAVSVGEVGVALALEDPLTAHVPHCRLALSTTTVQGLIRARTVLDGRVPCFYAPIDLPWTTRRALEMVRPHTLVLLETELWPNLIIAAHRSGVRTAMLNGRISVRAIERYRKVRPMLAHMLAHVDAFSMISTADAQRIISLGAPEERVSVNGNAKFDSPDPHPEREQTRAWAMQLYGLRPETPVFVAGSTRHPEERSLLSAFRQIHQHFPETVLIIAPRHLERVPRVVQWVSEAGLSCQRRSRLEGEGRHTPVVVLDTIGELAATYSVARFVFCGGSLVPKGGQNMLEPALWSKPVMYGASMEDFADARVLIERAGGGFMVQDADRMAALAIEWLRRPEVAVEAGRAARAAILVHRGAARRHAAVIEGLLKR
ncbi:3-deoxy-D-manno-octulosonic acid transferase [Desulfatitalea alkaliphila]|uniref:3-deoxy-D-manno-octulosonic acid transferase n=1 Tax=Desulfatitalea alkaliphila TaxID=2929485 RepID=A0AA41R377_9BACT|nr:glycosyltransferase N-terminal domain-containing protein [Desulfatitalea alkaliphila]MCJ8500075.1 hypothetical protein [Desulfatitalea alkaliphila]